MYYDIKYDLKVPCEDNAFTQKPVLEISVIPLKPEYDIPLKRATIELGYTDKANEGIILREYYENDESKAHPAKDVSVLKTEMPTIISKLNTMVMNDVWAQPNCNTECKLHASLNLLFKSEEWQKYYPLYYRRVCHVIFEQAFSLFRIFEEDLWHITSLRVEYLTHDDIIAKELFGSDNICKEFGLGCMEYFTHHLERQTISDELVFRSAIKDSFTKKEEFLSYVIANAKAWETVGLIRDAHGFIAEAHDALFDEE